jgi:hypothetical protein
VRFAEIFIKNFAEMLGLSREGSERRRRGGE